MPSFMTHVVWWVRSTQNSMPVVFAWQAAVFVAARRRATSAVVASAAPVPGLMPKRSWNFLMAAQSAAPQKPAGPPAATTAAKPPGKIKLTMQKLKDMKAKWAANKPKLKACRAEVKSKGLSGDDRWFYIEECMGKS